jgi:ribosomal protein S18 acetylase RimI-like enzyme
MKIIIQGPIFDAASVCEPILRSLPEWFGIEEATAQYIKDTDTLPTLLASINGEVVGFLTLKQHSDFAAEIHVMGVRPEVHRTGIGHALVEKAEETLRRRGVEYLQVKTLSPAHPDKHYARTREFYQAMGFRPLEEFKELWGEENPCLQLVKSLVCDVASA